MSEYFPSVNIEKRNLQVKEHGKTFEIVLLMNL